MKVEGGGKQSQRDFVIQPRVARNELPWVDDERIQNPNGVSSTSPRERDTTPMGLRIISWDALPRVARSSQPLG